MREGRSQEKIYHWNREGAVEKPVVAISITVKVSDEESTAEFEGTEAME